MAVEDPEQALAQKTAAATITSTNGTTSLAALDASKLTITLTTSRRPVPALHSPEVASQSVCTDHMVTVKWTAEHGWAAPELKPYGPLSLMPTASVLHYATECFEGMKVYRGFDGRLRLFRLHNHCNRMLMSSGRIALPSFDPAQLGELIKALVALDGAKWLPKERPGTFLYIRPTHIASAPALGLQQPRESTLFIIACLFPNMDVPMDPDAADESQDEEESSVPKGLQLLASSEDTVRAWPGGFGYAKVGANYGPSLIAQEEARERGFDQILWLLGQEAEVTEAGACNFFIMWRTREGRVQLVTAPLDDKIILPGITRDSVLTLTRERERLAQGGVSWFGGIEIVEKKFYMRDIVEAVEEGRLIEAFVTGTAFFIAPVRRIRFCGVDLHVSTAGYAAALKTWLTEIMWGKVSHEWGVVVDEADA